MKSGRSNFSSLSLVSIIRWGLLVIAAWNTSSWAAAVTVILNSSPAHECYLEVERDSVNPDFDACDSAIEIQVLGRKELAATHANRGILYGREGRLRAALADHNRAVKLAPELSATWINRANVYMRAQRFPEAMSDLDTAIRIADDRLGIAHYNRALLFQRIGDIESARSDGEKALALHPESEEILGFAKALNIVELPDSMPDDRAQQRRTQQGVQNGVREGRTANESQPENE